MRKNRKRRLPKPSSSVLPIITLISLIGGIIVTKGATSVLDYSWMALLVCSALAAGIAVFQYNCSIKQLRIGLSKSAKQLMPTIPILVLIATVAASWMMGGVVPTLISYGLDFLNPDIFLVVTCLVCAVISVLTGSSWTTCATIGVAFMGIGKVMGYNPAWIAGAVISGAYFGDKVSPLSDTTVLAASTSGVKLFDHVKYLIITTTPALAVALIVYLALGFSFTPSSEIETESLLSSLHGTFNISPWLLLVPLITCVLIGLRINSIITLSLSTAMGLAGMFVFQPQIVEKLAGDGSVFVAVLKLLCTSTSISTGNELLDNLVATGGVEGMTTTIVLILSAMVFGGMMLGSGMLSSITHNWLAHLRGTKAVVSTTVGSGLLINSCTGDQYLSIIITGNMFRKLYRRVGLEPRLLSRSLEDSISVTSVLIPWNSCGMTQSTVLGVGTLYYLPFAVFNIMCPIMSLVVAHIGYKIYRAR